MKKEAREKETYTNRKQIRKQGDRNTQRDNALNCISSLYQSKRRSQRNTRETKKTGTTETKGDSRRERDGRTQKQNSGKRRQKNER